MTGFTDWFQGIIFVFVFAVLIGVPCFLAAVIGSKMINDLGNFPTKAARIQMGVCWKLMAIMVATFGALALFSHIFAP